MRISFGNLVWLNNEWIANGNSYWNRDGVLVNDTIIFDEPKQQ